MLNSSKTLILGGFSFACLMMLVTIVIWAFNVVENEKNIEGIYVEQQQSRLVVDMRDAARRRAIILHRMTMMTDPFDRDDEYIKFKEMAGLFIQSRDELFALETEAASELEIWNRARPYIKDGELIQQQTVSLIMEDRLEEANKNLLTKVIPIQNKVNQTLSEMFAVQKAKAQDQFESAVVRNKRIFWWVIALGAIVIVLTFSLGVLITWRTTATEKSLQLAQKEAQASTEQKSQFLANMSHEIRTPMTAVLGFADSLLEKGLDDATRAEYIQRILQNGEHLLEIINDILDFSKIEAKQLSVENLEVSPVKLALDVEKLMEGRVQAKRLYYKTEVLFPVPKFINTDPTRLKQILLNLCGNALKFTEQGGITVRLSYVQSVDKMMYEIIDTGMGITQEQINNLFKAFSQADITTTRKYGGTGLGLSISKQLAKMLGGNLVCESELAKGSCFCVSISANTDANIEYIFDMNHPSLKETKVSSSIVPNLRGHVLVAEDGLDNQQLISLYVKKTGAEITLVENGRLAVEHALANRYNLILMDMQMPVMGGLEAVKWIRQTGNQTPIAMLTANAIEQEKERCLDLGANAFLTKPIDKRLFFKVLSEYLEQSGSQINRYDELESEVEHLKPIFLATLSQYVEVLDETLKSSNTTSLRAIVHKLKGAGGGFGFPRITEMGLQIESMLDRTQEREAYYIAINLLAYCEEILDQNSQHPSQLKVGT